ncbi:MAG: family 43 glycosylhydrolase [Clostridia bacterium]|nr:family 43 glycosylhydrolase [Clostridia bacterium]
MSQVYNPYLPDGEYIPDGEPHVFGDRVYLYGSHDKFNSMRYCPGDYVVWSAPVSDLSNWTNRGVSYPRRGVGNRMGIHCLWAPDCAKGEDGRYYLYYCFDFKNKIHVARSEFPDGPFSYYGFVHYPDGTPYGTGKKDIMCFDPAVLVDDDGEIYLYSGYSANENLRKMLNCKGIKNVDGTGNQVLRLEKDMLTVKGEPKMLIPGYKNSAGTGFEGHEMYEASSIRKIGGRYYFIYSSRLSHELAYAVSDRPDEGFRFGGAIISNGDIGLSGRTEKDAVNYWGNVHGSIEKIGERYYVFYHRQTNQTEQSRQGCAEPIEITEDGSIAQVEMTSQGLTGRPLKGEGRYPAYIACNLQSKEGALKCAYGPFSKHKYKMHPCISEYERGKQCVKGMRDGAMVGFCYFDALGRTEVSVRVRGSAGEFIVRADRDGTPLGTIALSKSKAWQDFFAVIPLPVGKISLYFTYLGKGKVDFLSFSLTKQSEGAER